MNTHTIHNYGDGSWGNYTYTFTYDTLNRLTNANSANTAFNSVYAYDGDGHMTTKNFAGVNNSFNRETTNHRIANILENGVSKSVSYDTRGNLTSDALSGWTTYEFNRSNLPLYMNSGNKSYRFGYNEKGERIAKDFEDDTTETKEKYLLDYLGRTLVVYNNRNMEGIINGNGLIGSIAVTDSSANYFYFMKDHLGNTRTTIDANGAVKTARDFGPYGETLREYSAEETVDRYQYTEKERDKESRDTYFGARYLSGYFPFWKSVDPLAEKYHGVSPYSYALGNPMRFVDPKGSYLAETADGSDPEENEKRKQQERTSQQQASNKQSSSSQNDSEEDDITKKLSIILNTIGITFETQNGIIALADKIDAGTAKIIAIGKGISKTIGIANFLIEGGNFINEPSFENGTKLGVATVTAFVKSNPWVAVGVGLADVTGISKPVYKTVGEIPNSINNGLKQIYYDMNRQLIPRGF